MKHEKTTLLKDINLREIWSRGEPIITRTDIGVVLRGSRVPGVYLILPAELRDLLVGHGDRYVAFVRQKHDRYARAIRQRDLLPEIVQPLLHWLEGRRARDVEYESRGHPTCKSHQWARD